MGIGNRHLQLCCYCIAACLNTILTQYFCSSSDYVPSAPVRYPHNSFSPRDVVLTKKVWEGIQNIAILLFPPPLRPCSPLYAHLFPVVCHHTARNTFKSRYRRMSNTESLFFATPRTISHYCHRVYITRFRFAVCSPFASMRRVFLRHVTSFTCVTCKHCFRETLAYTFGREHRRFPCRVRSL